MTAAQKSKVIQECMDQMHAISLSFPAWFAQYEDAPIDFDMSNEEVLALLKLAPNDFAAGVLFGKMMLRQHFQLG